MTSFTPGKLKGRLPFRLGATSYVIPADLISNVTYLAPLVDDVELVLFESQMASNMPGSSEIQALKRIAAANALSFTVHLPSDADLGHPDTSTRLHALNRMLRVIDLTAPLEPHGYLLHLDSDRQGRLFSVDPKRRRAALADSIEALLAGGAPRQLLCIENLSYPFFEVEDLVERFNLPVCIDIGHLLVNGYAPEPHLDKHLARCRIVHVHGYLGDQDHLAISHLKPELVRDLLWRFARTQPPDRVVSLEVFGEGAFADSMAFLETLGP